MIVNSKVFIFEICLLPLLIFGLHIKSLAQAEFSLNDSEFCQQEQVVISNQSANAVEYIWDFCPGSLKGFESYSNIGTIDASNFPNSISTVNDDGTWYGFVTNRSNNKLLRLEFESDLTNDPVVVDLGTLSGNLSVPRDMEFFQENNQWYALLVNDGNDKLLRLDFGSDLNNNSPAVTDISGQVALGLNGPRGITLAVDDGNIVATVTNHDAGRIVIINFGNSITNTPSSGDVITYNNASYSQLFGIDLIQENGNWYGLTTSSGNGKVFRLNFGTDLFSTPTSEDLIDIPLAVEVKIRKEGNLIYAFVLGRFTGIYRLEFDQDITSSPNNVLIGNNNNAFTDARALDIAYDQNTTDWFGFVIASNDKSFHRIGFNNTCSGPSVTTSTDFEPNNIFYSQSGTFTIGLTAFADNGNSAYSEKEIQISNSIAPDINFTFNNSCVASPTSFTSENTSGDIDSYSWDFGDNSGTSDVSNPSYSHSTEGTYDIGLTVNNVACDVTITKSLSLFDQPVADFSIPTQICTNSEVTFNNTSAISDGAPVTYSWDFNNDGVEDSNLENPSYTFTEAESQTVKLTVSLAQGCVSTAQKSFTVDEGAMVNFSWTNNCFGKGPVSFINEAATGPEISYQWNFGDGSTKSTLTAPSHTYTLEGEYIITLTVDNGICESSLSKTITIGTNQSDFSIDGDLVENVPIDFNGSDITPTDDNIVSWEWDFGDGSSGTGENISHSFESTGNYTIELTTTSGQGCENITSESITIIEAQNATPIFELPKNEFCQQEQVVISNQSANAVEYIWDFCPGSLKGFESYSNIGTIDASNFPNSISTVNDDGTWYGFVTNRSNNKLLRLEFESDLTNDPVVVDLGTLSGNLSVPRDMEFFQENNQWYALLVNDGNDKLLRLDFGSDLNNNSPAVTDISGQVALGLNGPRGITLAVDDGNIVATVTNHDAGRIVIINFGNSITNTPSSGDVITYNNASYSQLFGIDLIQENGNWYGLTTSSGNGKVFRLNFGTDLFSTPTSEDLIDIPLAVEVKIRKEGNLIYAFVLGRFTGIYRLEFDQDITSSPNNVLIGNNNNAFTDARALDIAYDQNTTDWFGFVIASNDKSFHRIGFNNTCSGPSVTTSTDFEPNNIFYSQSGTFTIGLTAFADNGNSAYSEKEIQISNSIAPDINFTFNNSCVASPTSFTSENTSGDIDSYSWDFGDNSGTSDVSNPSYSHSTEGTYDIGLTVNNVACDVTITKSLSLFDQPVADFSIPTQICTNSEVTFNNTSAISDGAPVTYSWDFNNDGVEDSNLENPSYTFTEAESQTVKLTVSLAQGCVSTAQKSFTVDEGAMVNFSWTNNCFGKGPVSFINEAATGPEISYQWNFGDGSTKSTLTAPSHTYTLEGEYIITLTVDNGICESSLSKTITIGTNQSDFSIDGDLVENVPIDFNGSDITPTDDNIVSWEWDFGDGSSGTGENISHSFESTGNYTIELTTTSGQGCENITSESITIIEAQNATPIFELPKNEFCQQEQVVISNQSANAVEYIWDFCPGSLKGFESYSNIGTIDASNFPNSISTVNDDGTWYGFVTNRSNNKLLRLEFESDLTNDPVVVDLGTLSGNLSVPRDMEFFQENNQWYALLVNDGNDKLLRLDFGSDLNNNSPAVTDISGQVALGLNGPRGITLAVDDGNIVATVTNHDAGRIVIINFGNSITNTPSSGDVITYNNASYSQLFGIDLIQENGNWYGLTTSSGNGKVFRLNFGTDLFSTPTSEDLIDIPLAVEVKIRKEGNLIYAFVLGRFTGIYRLEFDQDITSSPNNVLIGNNNNAFTDARALDIAYDQNTTDWFGFVIASNDKSFHRIGFNNTCSGPSVTTSTDFEPNNIFYSQSGTFTIGLTAFADNGNSAYSEKEIQISNSIAPDINFTFNNSCVASPTSFTSENTSGDIDSYSWDFKDVIETSTSPAPTIAFDTAGTYPIRLDVVGDNGCTNFVEQEITIYDPPQASFDITNTLFCEDDSIFFENTSLFDGPDSMVSYQWDFAGQPVAVSGNTGFVFDTPGTKAVQLSAAIPGCSTDTIQTIEINASPNPSFDFSDLCIDQITRFENTTDDTDIDSYLWEFGDGGEATQIAPNYQYSAPGDYVVRLTAVNEAGCDNFIERNIAIRALPQVGFEAEIGCAGQALQLIDTSIVDGANITQWQWDFAGLGSSEQPSPQFTFAEAGEYEITLTTTSNFGCSNTTTQVVEVRKAPVPDFSIEQGCFGEPVRLEDITITDQETLILDYFWQIEDNTFRNEAVSYIFDEPGEYDVSLTLDYLNLCSNTVTKTITILPPINADFENTQACDNNITFFTDLSTVQEDSIVSRTWNFAGLGSANGREAQFEFPEAGEYDITLTVLSARGCIEQVTKTVVVEPAPVAAFIPSSTFGPPPFNVFFENTSSDDARQFIWSVDDEVISSDSEDFEYTFNEIAIYDVTLTVIDSLGCEDSNTQSIRVDIPAYDLAIQEIQGANTADATNIVLRISNLATVDVEGIDLVIALENGIKLLEPLDAFIRYKSSIIYTLDTRLPADTPLESICINLPLEYQGLTDPTPINNEACINLIQSLVVGQPYPNPGDGKFRLDVVLPEDDNLDLELLNMQGQQVLFETYPNLKAGLQPLLLDYSNNRPGMYFLRIYTSDGVATRRVIIGF